MEYTRMTEVTETQRKLGIRSGYGITHTGAAALGNMLLYNSQVCSLVMTDNSAGSYGAGARAAAPV